MSYDDLDEVLAVEARTLGRTWSRSHFLVEIESPSSLCFVARTLDARGSKVVGFAIARVVSDEAELLTIAVEPSVRRRGVGAALLARARDDSRERGAASMHLEVRAGNTIAQRLYARAGFTEQGRRPRYYTAPVEDAVLMTGDLQVAPES